MAQYVGHELRSSSFSIGVPSSRLFQVRFDFVFASGRESPLVLDFPERDSNVQVKELGISSLFRELA